jgi:hypothetical protein
VEDPLTLSCLSESSVKDKSYHVAHTQLGNNATNTVGTIRPCNYPPMLSEKEFGALQEFRLRRNERVRSQGHVFFEFSSGLHASACFRIFFALPEFSQALAEELRQLWKVATQVLHAVQSYPIPDFSTGAGRLGLA